MPVTVYFYNIHDSDNISASPYLAKVNLEKKGYLVPRKGNVQVVSFVKCVYVIEILKRFVGFF